MAQTPPGDNFSLDLDWDTILIILGGIGLFFRDKIWGWFVERGNRADTRKEKRELQEQQTEQSSLEQVLLSQAKLTDYLIATSGDRLSKIEQATYKTIEQTRQTNTGLQFDRRNWEQQAERDEELLRWLQQIDKHLTTIQARLDIVEVVLKIETPAGANSGVRDTQERIIS